jgi:hypothetical protein
VFHLSPHARLIDVDLNESGAEFCLRPKLPNMFESLEQRFLLDSPPAPRLEPFAFTWIGLDLGYAAIDIELGARDIAGLIGSQE